MIVNGFGSSDTFHFEYVFKVPEGSKDYDGKALALAWVKKVWWRAVYHLLSRAATSMAGKAGILDVKPGKWRVQWYPQSNVLDFDGTLIVDHIESPFTQEEFLELQKIVTTLNLYNPSGVDTGYDMGANIVL